jgi:hypothetical protein
LPPPEFDSTKRFPKRKIRELPDRLVRIDRYEHPSGIMEDAGDKPSRFTRTRQIENALFLLSVISMLPETAGRFSILYAKFTYLQNNRCFVNLKAR